MRNVFFLALALPVLAFAASQFIEFAGEYHIGSAPVADPPTRLPKGTHAYFSVTGDAAKQIYEHMQAEPKLSICGVDHYEKAAGEFRCSYYSSLGDYSCDFSVDLRSGETDSGGYC